MFDYDTELSRYQPRLREALDVGPDDHVLDIGCGAGQTTREAARLAVRGSALGVDTSAAMVELAAQRADGLANVRFEQADAQVHPFPAARFSLAISRFGTMFFADPVQAFTNIGRALRPGARFVQLVWQDGARQEWVAALDQALGGGEPTWAPDPFSLGSPSTVDSVLTAAGFTGVRVTDVREPITYGADPGAAVDAVLALRSVGEQFARLGAGETGQALERLRSLMAAHHTAGGVWFDSRAWIVTARR